MNKQHALVERLVSRPDDSRPDCKGDSHAIYAGTLAEVLLEQQRRIADLEETIRDGVHPVVVTPLNFSDVVIKEVRERIENLEARLTTLQDPERTDGSVVINPDAPKIVTREFNRDQLLTALSGHFPNVFEDVDLGTATTSFDADKQCFNVTYLENLS